MQYALGLVLVVLLVLGGIWLVTAEDRHQDRMAELEMQRAIAREETKQLQAFYAVVASTTGTVVVAVTVVAVVIAGGMVIASRQPKAVYNVTNNVLLLPPPDMKRMEMWKYVAQLSPGDVAYMRTEGNDVLEQAGTYQSRRS